MLMCLVFFLNDTATTEINSLSLHDALPIGREAAARRRHFALALSSFLDLVAINLAGGAGPEGGLHHSPPLGEGWPFPALRQNRKRTPLKTSHGKISDARFCFKKKTNPLAII